MRVIADLVVNHTSDQHPWFRSARSSKDSPYRDFYVWRRRAAGRHADAGVFPDQEDSIWKLDEQTGEWYLHRFYKHQPDLNVTNPQVRDEIAKVMGFWLQLGISGFRVDAVPFLLETLGVDGRDATLPDPHDYLRALRALRRPAVRRRDPARRGEPAATSSSSQFFGGERGDELTMQFDFIGMQQLYLVAGPRATPRPLAEALRAPARSPPRLRSGRRSSATTTS